MNSAKDPRTAEALGKDIENTAERLGILGHLRRSGREWVGPCPACGGKDRFAINPDKQIFNCRGGGCTRGDVVQLVRLVLGCGFRDALTYLVGDAEPNLSPAEIAKRAAVIEAQRLERDRRAEVERRKAIEAAREIWRHTLPAEYTPVADYLRIRGLHLNDIPRALRYIPDHPYTAIKVAGEWVVPHRGPCMVALITRQGLSGRPEPVAVHQTWLDTSRANGKAEILHPETGEMLESKRTRGSVTGGMIRLIFGTSSRMIMGEGIETTLTAHCADPDAPASYFAGVSLGNMGGKMAYIPGVKYSALPDMTAPGMVMPAHIDRLTILMDGDSEAAKTRALCTAGLRRAMHHNPALRGDIAFAGEGRDFNDIAMQAARDARAVADGI